MHAFFVSLHFSFSVLVPIEIIQHVNLITSPVMPGPASSMYATCCIRFVAWFEWLCSGSSHSSPARALVVNTVSVHCVRVYAWRGVRMLSIAVHATRRGAGTKETGVVPSRGSAVPSPFESAVIPSRGTKSYSVSTHYTTRPLQRGAGTGAGPGHLKIEPRLHA